MSKSNDPIWWSLFAGGGVVSAFFLPVLIVITGIAVPLGLTGNALAYERLHGIVSHPAVRLALFGLIALPLFHWAHRFRFLVVDMGLRGHPTAIAVLCYGAAIAGTLLTGTVLWHF